MARIGLGTNRLTKTTDNIAFVRAAVAAGVQMIDTAHTYTSEQSDETIGEALSPVPEGCIVAVQNSYNLSERKHDAVVDYCAREGIVFVAFFPMRGNGGAALSEIAQRHGATPHEVMLAWLLRRSPVMLPIPGTLSLAHMKENLAALRLELTDREFESLC